jgi:hypothetical protein
LGLASRKMATAATPTTMGENPASLMSAVWTTPSRDTIISSNLENWLVASIHDRGVLSNILWFLRLAGY